MLEGVVDVHRTLAFGRQKLNRKWLLIGLVCLGLGVALLVVTERYTAKDAVMTALTFGLGAVLAGYALFRMIVPGPPLLVLSPRGIRLRIEWVKDIDIPWREVRGVETTDISGVLRGHTITLHGVTVVLVSRAFYERHIHVGSWLLRGPGWDFNFVPQGEFVQVALQHEALPVEAADLRAAVEARWRAFREAERTSVPVVGGG